jgi:hypothetical protein
MTNTVMQNNFSKLEWQRFEQIGAWAVLIGVFTTLFGLSWDVQWHTEVGPDSFWTLPHIFVYAGAALTGAAALTVVLLCTFAKEQRRAGWIPVFGFFHAPIGFIVSGFGAFGFLLFGLFDQYWHVIFGFDVSISSPPHLGLIFSDVLSMVGCALIFVRGNKTQTVGISIATALAIAFSLPFMIAIFADFNFDIPLLGLQAVLIPLGMLFVVSSTRQPYAALLMTVVLVAFRWMCELIFPSITLAYAESLGLSLRDFASNRPELPMLIPVLSPIAGLLIMGLLMFWKTRGLPVLIGALLSGTITAPILYLDSSLIPMQDGGALLLIPIALVGAFSAWLGWQLGVVTRNANAEINSFETVKA